MLIGGVLLVLGLAYVPALTAAGAAVATLGALLLYAGFRAESARGVEGVLQRLVELFDALLRTGSNVLSFTRLAAFGLMHAAIGEVVVDGASALAGGAAGDLAAASAVRARQRVGLYPGGPRRGGAGSAPGVLRALLARVRRGRTSVSTLEHPAPG